MDALHDVWPPAPWSAETDTTEGTGPEHMVRTARANGVGYVVLDRPQRRNALDGAMRDAIIVAIQRHVDDDEVRVIVLSGRGKTFAAGADIKEMLGRTPEEQRAFIEPPHVYGAITASPKPVIAAVNGHALGAGCELAMACDTRIVTERAKMGQPEINLGLIPGAGGTQRLARLVGVGRAMRMVLSGQLVDGQTAATIGLAEECVSAKDFHKHVRAFAEGMAQRSAVALREAKRALQATWEVPLAEGLAAEIDHFMHVFEGADAKEGMRAFLEKRPPRFGT